MLRPRQLGGDGDDGAVVCLVDDVGLGLCGERERLLPPESPLVPFVAQGPAQLRLRARPGRPALPRGAALLFDSSGLWRVYRHGKTHSFVVHNGPGRDPDPLAVATLDLAVGEGELRVAAGYCLQYPLDEILFAWLLARHQGLIVHACAASRLGQGSLCAGVSGAGKSTLARLLHRADARVLSDDRVAVRLGLDGPTMSGTPWPGAAGFARPETVPLGRLLFLRHASRTAARRLDTVEAVARLLALSVLPYWDPAATERAMAVGAELARRLPAFELGFRPDNSAIEAMDALDHA